MHQPSSFSIVCFGLNLLVLLCCCASLHAQKSKDIEPDEISNWVSKLGDPDPGIRQNAELVILGLGERALPEVKRGIQSSSLEVNRRCKILFEKIELQRKKRISEIFLADDFDRKELNRFKAWPAFSKFTDSEDVATRKMFLKMCKQIPLVFEEYEIKGERTAAALKQLARLVLVQNKHPGASSESIVMAYLFLVDRAEQANQNSKEPLFGDVEILEAVSFFSNDGHASVGKKSDNREVIDRAVANWIKAKKPFKSSTDESRWKLIYRTSNLDLISDLENEYDSMEPEFKLKYVDVVSAAFLKNDEAALSQCWSLLKKPLADEAVVVESRFRRRPAEKIDVSIMLLSETRLSILLKNSGENAEQIELDAVFGRYPLSSTPFSIIKNENDRAALSDRVQARISNSDIVK